MELQKENEAEVKPVSPVQSRAAKLQETIDINLAAAEARRKLTDSVTAKRKQTAAKRSLENMINNVEPDPDDMKTLLDMTMEQRQELMKQIDEKYQSGELPSEPGQEFQPEPELSALQGQAALELGEPYAKPEPAEFGPAETDELIKMIETGELIKMATLIGERFQSICDVMFDIVSELRAIKEAIQKN